MAITNNEIDNTVRYTNMPGLKLLAFALLFLVTGIFTIIKFDSYFTDFWKIAECRNTGYSRGYFMTDCQAIKIDRYGFGALYGGVEKEVVQRVQNADVIILGNSRTKRSFASDAIKEYFDDNDLTYFSLAVEGSSFRAAVFMIEELNLSPKIILINNEIFYSDKISDAFLDIVNFPQKYETRFKFFHAATSMQKRICDSNIEKLKSRYCTGRSPSYWRSMDTGLTDWNMIAKPEDQVLINYNPEARINQLGNFIGNASELLDNPNLGNSCPILYIVNSPSSAPKLLNNMANYLGVQSAFAHVDGIYTYDKSHLDRPNSEKWAKEFVKVLAPTIDNCLTGQQRKNTNTPDLSTSIVDGVTDFETWRNLADASVVNNGAPAPDGTQSADIISIPKPGAKIQNVFKSQKIEKGATITYGAWLWADKFVNMRIQIIRSCSPLTPVETTRKIIPLTPRPQRYEISITFEHDHECALVQLVGLKADTNIFAWQGKYDYTPPQPLVEQ